MSEINWPSIIEGGLDEFPDEWGTGILGRVGGGLDLDTIMDDTMSSDTMSSDMMTADMLSAAISSDNGLAEYKIVVNGGYMSNKSATTVDEGLRDLFNQRQYYDVVKHKPKKHKKKSRVKWVKTSKTVKVAGPGDSIEIIKTTKIKKQKSAKQGRGESLDDINGGSEESSDAAEESSDDGVSEGSTDDEAADGSIDNQYDSADSEDELVADGLSPISPGDVEAEAETILDASTEAIDASIADAEAYIITPNMCEIIGMK